MSNIKPVNGLLILIAVAISVVACEDYDDHIVEGFADDTYPRGLDDAEMLIEAEDRTSDHSCNKRSNHSGFTGSGYMDFGGKGSWIRWNDINASQAGTYTLTFRYATGGPSPRPAAILVNGQNKGNVSFANTGSWTRWRTVSIKVSLRRGDNTIQVKASTSRGGPNLDNVVVTPMTVVKDDCPDDPNKTEPGLCGCGVKEGTCGPGGGLPYKESFDSMGGSFKCSKNSCTWTSPTIDTSGATSLVVTADTRCYELGQFESADYLKMSFRVDGGAWKTFFHKTGDLKTAEVRETLSSVGRKLNLRIEAKTSAGNETYQVDNLRVQNGGPSENDLPVDCRDYQDPNGKVVKLRSSGRDDTDNIQDALKGLGPGDTLELSGSFHYTRTIYIPNGVSWILNGSMTLKDPANRSKNLTSDLDMVGYKKFNGAGKRVFDNNRRTAIAVAGNKENSPRARICMMGGTYYGEANTHIDWGYYEKTGKRPTRIRLLNFIWIKDSLFLDMNVEDASDDCFTLGSKSTGNRVVGVTGKHAGGQSELDNNISKKVMGGNGLSDYGDNNKWYDCIAEYNGSDGFTPKCKNSEFHRCIARFNNGPGWGAYARLDGTLIAYTLGTEIDNNRFVDIVAHNNETEGISMNISANCKPKATIRNNYISGTFYENKHVGVFFRNKAADGIVKDNEVHAILYDNESKSALGGGLSTDAKPSIGAFVTGLSGTVVAFDNENEEVDLGTAKDSAVVLYHPSGTTVSAEVGNSSYDNDVSIQKFTCSPPPEADVCQEYCAQ